MPAAIRPGIAVRAGGTGARREGPKTGSPNVSTDAQAVGNHVKDGLHGTCCGRAVPIRCYRNLITELRFIRLDVFLIGRWQRGTPSRLIKAWAGVRPIQSGKK